MKHPANKYLLHPLVHSLKICAYILAFNLVFGLMVYFIGEDNIVSFLNQSGAFAPLFSVFVGLIPNCGSSVIITELYLNGVLSFGSLIGGVLTGSGVAILVLFKTNKTRLLISTP